MGMDRFEDLGWQRSGGMALLERVRDRANGEVVALKSSLGAEHDSAIAHEFAILREVRHALLPAPRAYGHTRTGRAALTRTWAEGQPLEPGAIKSTADLSRILGDLLAVLAQLHQHGWVHLDLKPEHLIRSADGAMQLVDLGLCRRVGERPTEILGTLPYVAPEVLRGAEVDARTDLYSVGLLGLHLLTGTLPFRERGGQRIAREKLEEAEEIRNRAATAVARSVEGAESERWSSWLCSLLMPDPAQRPATALVAREAMPGTPPLPPVVDATFVGRDKLLATIASARREAGRCGRGTTLLLQGAPGCGKSRLLREAIFSAQEENGLAYWCRLDGGATGAQPLAALGAPLETGDHVAPMADPMDQLLAIVEERGRAGEAVLLGLESSGHPDAEEVITQCAAATAELPLVLVTDHLLTSKSAAPTVAGATAQILTLEPLDREAVRALAIDQLGPRRGSVEDDFWSEVSGGNPRHLIALLGQPERVRGELAADFLAYLRARAATVGAEEREILEFLALAPARFPATALAAASNRPPATVDRILERLRCAGLVVGDGGWSHGRCSHPRLALKRLGGYLRRQMGHDRLRRRAQALASALADETDPDLVGARSHLHLLGGNHRQALDDALAIGRSTEARPEQRIRSLRRALKLVAEEERPQLDIEIAEQLGRAGRIQEGLELLASSGTPDLPAGREARGALLLRAGDLEAAADDLSAVAESTAAPPTLRVRAQLHLSRLRNRQGKRERALDLAQGALDLAAATTPDSPEERDARSLVGRLLLAQGDLDRARAVLELALRKAQTAKDRRTEASAHNNLGLVAMAAAQWESAYDHFRHGLDLQLESGAPTRLATAWDNLGIAAHRLGRAREATAALERSIRYRLRVGDPKRLADSFNNLGALYHSLHDDNRALPLLRRALELRRDLAIPADISATLNNLALVHAARSELRQAHDLLAEAIEIRTTIGDRLGAARARVNLAALHTRRGRYEDAQSCLETAEHAAVEAPALQLSILEHRAEAELAGGSCEAAASFAKAAMEHAAATGARRLPALFLGIDAAIAANTLDTARQLLKRAEAVARQESISTPQVAALYRRAGEVQWRSGDLPEAIASIGKAWAQVERAPDSMEEAACLRVKGEILLARAHWEDAREQLECAAAKIEGLHAPVEHGRSLIALATVLEHLDKPAEAASARDRAAELLGKNSHWIHSWPIPSPAPPSGTAPPTGAPATGNQRTPGRPSGRSPGALRGPDPIEMLRRVGELLTRLGDPDALLADALTIVLETIGAERGQIALRDPETGELVIRVARNMDATTREDAVHHSRTILRRTLDSAAILFSEDAQQDATFREFKSVVQFRIVSFICVPMLRRGQAIGTIYVDNRSVVNRFDRRAADFLQVFASLAARALENAELAQRLRSENVSLRREIRESWQLPNLIGHSPAMRRIAAIVRRVAPTDSSVLLLGETGTGKEVLARAIHSESDRAGRPFVAVDCGALQRNLIESELFGHRRGAFSGAVQEKPGLFEAADGGTILLDEIANLDLPLQARLLRVLQEGEVRRVGDNRSRHVDVRVICATNEDLRNAVAAGTFRQDLFFRINIVPIQLPPLRQRRSDIPLLTAHFLESLRKRTGHAVRGLSPEVTNALLAYDWPGNVRELENTLEGMVVLASGERLTEHDLPPWLRNPAGQKSATLQRSEREVLIAALESADWIQTRAARELGISERVLRYKMKKHGIDNPRRRRRS